MLINFANLFSILSILIALLTAIIGFIFTIYQIKLNNKIKHAEFVFSIREKIRIQKEIKEGRYLIEYNKKWYNENFHNNENEQKIDALFSILDHICFLKNKQLLDDCEFSIFEYDLMIVFYSDDCWSYLWNLYHWSRKKPPFKYLIDYLKSKLDADKKIAFESSCLQRKGFASKKYLSF